MKINNLLVIRHEESSILIITKIDPIFECIIFGFQILITENQGQCVRMFYLFQVQSNPQIKNK